MQGNRKYGTPVAMQGWGSILGQDKLPRCRWIARRIRVFVVNTNSKGTRVALSDGQSPQHELILSSITYVLQLNTALFLNI